MKIIKLLSAIKNIDQIYEGVKNKIFKSEDVEEVANERWLICKGCPSLDTGGKNCAAPGTQPCCSDCGSEHYLHLALLDNGRPYCLMN